MAQRVVSNTSRKQINAIITTFTRSNYSTAGYFNERLSSSRRQTSIKVSSSYQPIIQSSLSLHTTSVLFNEKEETKQAETYADVVREKEAKTGEELEEWQNANSTWDGRIWTDDYKPGEEIPYVKAPLVDDGSGKVLAAPHVRKIAEDMLSLNMFELFQLVTMMGKYYGLDMTLGSAGGSNAGGTDAKEEVKVEEKTLFELKLTGFDAKSKIKVIKEIRAITALGLKEAKELVEGAPKVIKKDIKKEEAEELKLKIEAVGGTVEIE